MPSYYNLPAAFGNASVEDVDKFQKLPFYLAMNEVKLFPRWNIWDQLFGSIKWQPNMGSIMRGVTPQPSPVGNQFFFPQNVTGQPLKDMFETDESTEEARLKWHRYESKQFSFLPSFQDFRKNYLDYADKDMARQIQIANNLFIRSVIFSRAPNVYIVKTGANSGLQGAPANDGSSNPKGNGWLGSFIDTVDRPLWFKAINLAATMLREDLQAPFFEGVQNMPKDNELIKGKYVLIGSTELWSQLIWDPALSSLKSINMDLVYQGLQGSLFGFVTYKSDPFPLRIAVRTPTADDPDQYYFPVPQVVNNTTKKVRPNPEYVNAGWEVAFLTGADSYRSIKVGPPPNAFANKAINAGKFYRMNWNGEIQMTDQVLITTESGGNVTSVELNRYGTQLQLISQVIHGIIAGELLNCVPIIYKRERVALS